METNSPDSGNCARLSETGLRGHRPLRPDVRHFPTLLRDRYERAMLAEEADCPGPSDEITRRNDANLRIWRDKRALYCAGRYRPRELPPAFLNADAGARVIATLPKVHDDSSSRRHAGSGTPAEIAA